MRVNRSSLLFATRGRSPRGRARSVPRDVERSERSVGKALGARFSRARVTDPARRASSGREPRKGAQCAIETSSSLNTLINIVSGPPTAKRRFGGHSGEVSSGCRFEASGAARFHRRLLCARREARGRSGRRVPRAQARRRRASGSQATRDRRARCAGTGGAGACRPSGGACGYQGCDLLDVGRFTNTAVAVCEDSAGFVQKFYHGQFWNRS
jgi:hypothetical protein